MNKWQTMVEEFHREFGCTVGDKAHPEIRDGELRLKLLDEEFAELREAIDAGDLIAAVDAIADITYLAVGTAVAFGVDLDPAVTEVHASNMTKTGGFRRSDGKVLKGQDYRPPDLERIIWRQRRAEQRRRNGE